MSKRDLSVLLLGMAAVTIIPMLLMMYEHMHKGQYSLLQGLLDEIVE